MKYLTIVALIISFNAFAQKPGLKDSYQFKQTPKISLESLRIPNTAGKHVYMKLPAVDGEGGEKVKKRGPAIASRNIGPKNVLSLSGACTQQNGGIVSPGDPRYDSVWMVVSTLKRSF